MAKVGPASRGVRVSLPAVPSAKGHAKAEALPKAEAWRRRRHQKFSPVFTWFQPVSPSFTWFHFPTPRGDQFILVAALLRWAFCAFSRKINTTDST
jgi:uncharacterized membrane-anchored protein